MNITIEMLEALEEQIAMLEVLVLEIPCNSISFTLYTNRKQNLEKLLEECKKGPSINSNINLDDNIDQGLVHKTLDKFIEKKIINNGQRTRTKNVLNDAWGEENVYNTYTWRKYYEKYYHNKSQLIHSLHNGGEKIAEIIILLLDELVTPIIKNEK
jgi:hypothetical protein